MHLEGDSKAGRCSRKRHILLRYFGPRSRLDFNAHDYGPYSAVLDSTIGQLKNLGFIGEDSTGYGVSSEGFELRRYDYTLSSDGKKLLATFRNSEEYRKVASAVTKIKEAGDPGYLELSIAAKAYFILDKKQADVKFRDQARGRKVLQLEYSAAVPRTGSQISTAG